MFSQAQRVTAEEESMDAEDEDEVAMRRAHAAIVRCFTGDLGDFCRFFGGFHLEDREIVGK